MVVAFNVLFAHPMYKTVRAETSFVGTVAQLVFADWAHLDNQWSQILKLILLRTHQPEHCWVYVHVLA